MPRLRALVATLVALACCGTLADAQIFAVSFTDAKAAKKYKKYTTVWNGETVVLGEPVPGGGIRIDDGTINFKGDRENEFFVLNTKDPSKVPYRIQDGEQIVTNKRSIVGIHGKYIGGLRTVMRTETIETIADEYKLRLYRVDELKEARDSHDKGSVPWFTQHFLMLGEYERLISWLEAISFVEAAERIEKSYKKEAKRVAGEAVRQRGERAKESVELLGKPEALVAAQEAAGGASYDLRVAESQHLRIVYWGLQISDDRVENLLAFGEEVIEGFRNQFVDPYVGEDFAEKIPDDAFQEFYFGPDDPPFHEKFVVEFYGFSWGDAANKKRRFESRGNRFARQLGGGPPLVDLWRIDESEDLEGIIAHTLGHSLADYHFHGGPFGMQQPWMEEGLGYYLSFEFLGRNNVTCKEFRKSNYVKQVGEEGRKEVRLGYRDTLNAAALDFGPRMDRLMLKYLYDMEDADLAKAWSFFEYVARKTDKTGQRWLRAACRLSKNRKSFIDELRQVSQELYGVDASQDVYKVLDERWRDYAQNEMDTEY